MKLFKRIMAALRPKPELWGDDKPEGYPPGMPEFAREAYDRMKGQTIDEIFEDLDAEIAITTWQDVRGAWYARRLGVLGPTAKRHGPFGTEQQAREAALR